VIYRLNSDPATTGKTEQFKCLECGGEFERNVGFGFPNPRVTCSKKCRHRRKNGQTKACIRIKRAEDPNYDKKEKARNKKPKDRHGVGGQPPAPHLKTYNKWGIDRKMIQNMRPDQIERYWDDILRGSGIFHTAIPINEGMKDE